MPSRDRSAAQHARRALVDARTGGEHDVGRVVLVDQTQTDDLARQHLRRGIHDRVEDLVEARSLGDGALDDRELLEELPQGVLGLLARGDVAGDRVERRRARVGPDHPFQPPVRAVAMTTAVVEVERVLTEDGQPPVLGHRRLAVVGVHEFDHRMPEQVVARVAERLSPRRR